MIEIKTEYLSQEISPISRQDKLDKSKKGKLVSYSISEKNIVLLKEAGRNETMIKMTDDIWLKAKESFQSMMRKIDQAKNRIYKSDNGRIKNLMTLVTVLYALLGLLLPLTIWSLIETNRLTRSVLSLNNEGNKIKLCG